MLRKLAVFKVFVLLCFAQLSQAQTTRLNGRVLNPTNEPVSGASVAVEGLNRTVVANVEGRFTLNLETGKKYVLTVSSVGYQTKVVEEVEVQAGIENEVTVVLEPSNAALGEVVIRSSARRESSIALINFQKNNTSLSSGIAADFIRRTPDRNTGEVLKRVSGASIQDNRYIVIRGLADRYNQAFINNAQLPSS